MSMTPEMIEEISTIASLRIGDAVSVTRDGRSLDMTVTTDPHRGDSGGFGSVESTRVTVSLGPGRYSATISADAVAHGYTSITKAEA